jgi:glycosyltransferase involved in cell wall biosynthesis
LPQDLRRRAVYAAIDVVAPTAEPPESLRPGPLVVGGSLSTASGLGESARLCLEALVALGWETSHLDLSDLFLRADLRSALPGPPATAGEGGILIEHVNGPLMPYVALRLGRRFLAGRRIIGYWAWELSKTGPDWRRGLAQVHEIWVPSRFTAEALPTKADVPIRIVPHAVVSPLARPDRARFSLPDDAFVVLTAFDMGSSYYRKNPRAAVAAFRKAFGDDPSCLLLLKIGHPGDANWAMADLAGAIAGMGNVRLFAETLSRAEMTGLIASADAVLSLHRSEGFGLLPAEAMMQGVPAVATGWSGNLDFMTEDDSALIGYKLVPVSDPQGTYAVAGAEWAEADTDQAAAWLTRLRDDPALRHSLGERGRAAVRDKLSLAAFERAVSQSLPPRER